MDGGGTARPFIYATFLVPVLPSIDLAVRGCGNAESKVYVPLVEGDECCTSIAFSYNNFAVKICDEKLVIVSSCAVSTADLDNYIIPVYSYTDNLIHAL